MPIPKAFLTAVVLALMSAAASDAAAAGFAFAAPIPRMITPNGDGLNDAAVFPLTNPRDSSGVIRIYDLRGRHLRDLPFSGTNPVSWDARVDGRLVDAGVYIYVMTIENQTHSGSLVVVR